MDFENFIYKGIKLPEYCDLIGVPLCIVKNIYRRLRRTKMHASKSNSELLTYIMDHIFEFKVISNYKLWYHNEPLIIYCQTHPKHSYDSLVAVIFTARQKDPDRTVDDILDEYFKCKRKSFFRPNN